MKQAILIISLFFSFLCFGQGKLELAKHVFQGEIIRSYAFHPQKPNEILVGLKGKQGEAKVYHSTDYGLNWNVLNKGKALCDSCEDVQAIAFIDDETFIAGTWKNGLYLSTNSGKKFNKVSAVPASDIRSIAVSPAGIVYVATTTLGIVKTEDKGRTWQSPHPSDLNTVLPSWKIYLVPSTNKILYACTFQNGLYKTTNGGVDWKQEWFDKDIMIWDIELVDNEIFAVGSSKDKNYLFYNVLGGKKWKKYELNMYGSVNSLHIMQGFKDYSLILGTWENGLQYTFAIEPSNDGYRCVEFVEDDSIGVQDSYSNEHYLYNFSWGDGIRIYTREKECDVDISSVYKLTSTEGSNNMAVKASCDLDYCKFKLYDRWGSLMYESIAGLDSVNAYFKNNQSKLEPGKYVYWMKSSFVEDADTVSLKGHMVLEK